MILILKIIYKCCLSLFVYVCLSVCRSLSLSLFFSSNFVFISCYLNCRNVYFQNFSSSSITPDHQKSKITHNSPTPDPLLLLSSPTVFFFPPSLPGLSRRDPAKSCRFWGPSIIVLVTPLLLAGCLHSL